MGIKWPLYSWGSPNCQCGSGLCGLPLPVITDGACGEYTARQNICRKSGTHQGQRLKRKSIGGGRSTSLLLLVCQNVFNGFIGYFSHLRNWHEKGLACNNFLSLTYKITLFFSFGEFYLWSQYCILAHGFQVLPEGWCSGS